MKISKLCKCNNCETVLIYQNPQVCAKEHKLTGGEKEMKLFVIGVHNFWGCPECRTDEYLTDYYRKNEQVKDAIREVIKNEPLPF